MQKVLHDKTIAGFPDIVPAAARSYVLRVIAYFDIFQYPLKKNEIKQFIGHPVNDHTLELTLNALVAEEVIFFYNGFYLLHNNPLPVNRRIHGNLRAAVLLPRAQRIGKFLYKFPFVSGIGISGSLSKNFADENADIDFFIITKSNRLWIARTLMHLFKKLAFLTGRQHFYCMNYYVDEQALQLNERSIFTAIEIKTLLPVSGAQTFLQFLSVNQWANEWLPYCEFRKQADPDPKRTFFKKSCEWICNNRLGNSLDNYLMRITAHRWKQKEERGEQNEKGQKMGLITGKHFARSNPGGFQEKVLRNYEQKLRDLRMEG
jgi:hypothetical protein